MARCPICGREDIAEENRETHIIEECPSRIRLVDEPTSHGTGGGFEGLEDIDA